MLFRSTPSAVASLPKSIRVRRRFGSIPRMPWAKSSPLMRLIWPVRSRTRLDRGHPNNGAHMALATVDRDESPHQGKRIDAIGLHSARPSIDLDACRIEHHLADLARGYNRRRPRPLLWSIPRQTFATGTAFCSPSAMSTPACPREAVVAPACRTQSERRHRQREAARCGAPPRWRTG